MLQKLRQQYGMSRHQLAEALNLSPGYILKAEQCVFPSPPAPLIEYWSRQAQVPRQVLKTAYVAQQATRRREWLNSWIPDHQRLAASSGAEGHRLSGFCSLWVNRFSENYRPSQYAVSSGLCVPPSAVYWAERHPDRPLASSILTAVDQLCDYATSGEFQGSVFSMDDNAYDVVADLLALKEVIKHNVYHSQQGIGAQVNTAAV